MTNRTQTQFWEMYKNMKPLTSGNHRDKIICEMANLIKEMLLDFNKPVGNTPDRWARRLGQNNYTISEVQIACSRASETCRFMPSYAEFKSLLGRSHDPEKIDKEDKVFNEKYETEQKRFHEMRNNFVSNFGEKKLKAYYERWLILVFGDSVDLLNQWGLDKSLFLKTALFDLSAVNMKMDRIPGHVAKWKTRSN